ncbi:ExbD/TolR family protein [Blastochloris viridis]|uniref:Biopolymer transport protein exbD n=1 Tax=Blastochloris viridis TaxID=1079 RepID=A0A0H5BH96_BLAVI|nr:biopolymer transporter ExbD [Blastochloris viridis]ALK09615.1 Biopolymer transport protein ExbD [Blastochloris viridis]BAS00495.1 biopolymer transport protein ExbD/TolR [Blastochloris viridis]CUU42278.1 Biopolymer transport protein exbD [Blastochloris viridis]
MSLGGFGGSRPGGHRPSAEINVTPLVDVMLVLLVVFMITAPLLAAGLKLDLPRASTAKPLDPKDPVVVSVDRDGRIAVDQGAVAREELAAAVLAKIADGERTVRVRGDRELAYGEVVGIVDVLVAAGIRRIALVTDPKAAQRPGQDARSGGVVEAPAPAASAAAP